MQVKSQPPQAHPEESGESHGFRKDTEIMYRSSTALRGAKSEYAAHGCVVDALRHVSSGNINAGDFRTTFVDESGVIGVQEVQSYRGCSYISLPLPFRESRIGRRIKRRVSVNTFSRNPDAIRGVRMKGIHMSTMHISHFARVCMSPRVRVPAATVSLRVSSKWRVGSSMNQVPRAKVRRHTPSLEHVSVTESWKSGFCDRTPQARNKWNFEFQVGRVPTKFTSRESFGHVREDMSDAHNPKPCGNQRRPGDSPSELCQCQRTSPCYRAFIRHPVRSLSAHQRGGL